MIQKYFQDRYGIDFKAPIIEIDKIKTFEYILENKIPFENDNVDIITMLAVLEHLSDQLSICIEIKRVLKKDGLLIITVPSKISKPVLEFLAYKLHIVSEDEIRDHKQYFDRKTLINLFDKIDGFEIIKHKYFQMGMNNFCIIKKLPRTYMTFK